MSANLARRDVAAGLAFAGTTVAAATPASAGADPLLGMVAEWREEWGRINKMPARTDADEEALAAAIDAQTPLERRIVKTVPSSIAGAIALLDFARDGCDMIVDPDDGEDESIESRLVRSLRAGLRQFAEREGGAA